MNPSDPSVFANRLRSFRTERGLTQQELAARAGVSSRSVSDLERGINQRPRRETAIRLADVLGLGGADRLAFLDSARSQPRTPTVQVRPDSYPTLPPRPSPLQGRETELRAIEHALLGDRVRLLTLTGPGGVGKTRLAIEVARRQAVSDRFRDGVLFVRLDGLRDPQLVLPTLAGELQLLDTSSDAAISERIAAYLADREMLLILDNLEHLEEAALGLSALLARGTSAQFLVTSRDSLRIQGEHVLAVPPLPRPDPATWQDPGLLGDGSRSAAIAVYVQRARVARPDLIVTSATEGGRTNLAVIAETCHRLDGLPLAIELAAAQMESLSAADVLEQLKIAGLPLLADGRHGLPARHQTMTAAIGWSYDRLSTTEQALLRALAIFAGSFSLPAASAVFGMMSSGSRRTDERSRVEAELDPVQLRTQSRDPASRLTARAYDLLDRLDANVVQIITSLARHHLLFQDTVVADHVGPRFRMLEPIRLFALERLREAGEEPAARLRHAEYFTGAATVLDALAFGADPQVWLERQVVDLDNFRSAQDWLLARGEDDLAVQLTAAIAQLWLIKGLLPEARQRVSAALAVDAAALPATRWFLRFWAGTFAFESGDLARAGEYARELLAIAEEHDDRRGGRRRAHVAQPRRGSNVRAPVRGGAIGGAGGRNLAAAGARRVVGLGLEPAWHRTPPRRKTERGPAMSLEQPGDSPSGVMRRVRVIFARLTGSGFAGHG